METDGINVNLVIEQSNNETREKTESKRNFCACMMILLGMIAFFGGFEAAKHHIREHTELVTDTIVIYRWDTITINQPSEVIRYVYRYDTIRDSSITFIVDTISASPTAIIPIERTIYRDSVENAKYTAFLSGFHASLDSIFIECLAKESVITVKVREKASRFGFGIQAGVGISAKGLAAPYVGVGVQYRLFGK